MDHVCPGGSCSSPGISHCLFRASSVCKGDPKAVGRLKTDPDHLSKPYDCIEGLVRGHCLV